MSHTTIGCVRGGLVVLWAFTAGCATVGGLIDSEGDGETSYYREDTEVLLDASLIAFADLGFKIEEYRKEPAYVLASKGASMGSYGEVVGVFVRPSSQDSTVCAVRVVSRKRLITNVLARNWESEVFRRLETQLDPEVLLLASHGEEQPPTMTRAEARDCVALAERSRAERREGRLEKAGAGPDLNALNACLSERGKELQ